MNSTEPTLHRHVALTDADDGAVLLDQQTGRYWLLNDTAATVARVLARGGAVTEATAQLLAHHPERAERIETDVASFLDSLRDAELITS